MQTGQSCPQQSPPCVLCFITTNTCLADVDGVHGVDGWDWCLLCASHVLGWWLSNPPFALSRGPTVSWFLMYISTLSTKSFPLCVHVVPVEVSRRGPGVKVGGNVEDPRARPRERGDDVRQDGEASEPHSSQEEDVPPRLLQHRGQPQCLPRECLLHHLRRWKTRCVCVCECWWKHLCILELIKLEKLSERVRERESQVCVGVYIRLTCKQNQINKFHCLPWPAWHHRMFGYRRMFGRISFNTWRLGREKRFCMIADNSFITMTTRAVESRERTLHLIKLAFHNFWILLHPSE